MNTTPNTPAPAAIERLTSLVYYLDPQTGVQYNVSALRKHPKHSGFAIATRVCDGRDVTIEDNRVRFAVLPLATPTSGRL